MTLATPPRYTAANGTAVPGGVAALLGLAAVLVLAGVLAQLGARRAGGWRVVRRGLRREAAMTAAAFAAPVRSQLRYRRQLRLLRGLLSDPIGWADAERAMLDAARVPGVQPYAALLGQVEVGVLVAARSGPVPQPPEPWTVDEADPRLWWTDRADAAGAATSGRPAPLLAALGTDGRHAVLFDLASGPVVTEVGGERGTARAVLQAVAAQLDTRLPAGAVTVAAGVHPRHPGPDPAEALRTAQRTAAGGGPAFAVCAEAPAEARPGRGARLLVLAGARGSARLLTAERDGLRVHGTALRIDAGALARATARSLRLLPPYPALDTGPADETDLAEPEFGADGPGAVARPAPAPPGRPDNAEPLPGRSALAAAPARREPPALPEAAPPAAPARRPPDGDPAENADLDTAENAATDADLDADLEADPDLDADLTEPEPEPRPGSGGPGISAAVPT